VNNGGGTMNYLKLIFFILLFPAILHAHGAGITPYIIEDGKILLLLGKDSHAYWSDRQNRNCPGAWADFGGELEAEDGGHDFVTGAAREGHEETMGLLPLLNMMHNDATVSIKNYCPDKESMIQSGIKEMKKLIDQNRCVEITLDSGFTYKMFFIDISQQVAFAGGKDTVVTILKELRSNMYNWKYAEKSDFKWFAYDDVLNGCKRVGAGYCYDETLQLRSELKNTLWYNVHRNKSLGLNGGQIDLHCLLMNSPC